MGYYIGIEGGGTKTAAMLGGSRKEIIDATLVGATNYHSVGLEKTGEEIGRILSFFKDENNVEIEEIRGICFGGAGVNCSEDERQIRQLFDSLGYKGKLRVCNDSVVALAGANGCLEGAILISGTGSIAYGVDVNGESVRVGGWGHIIDDAGSGYAIAIDCLKKIVRGYDGRGQKTLLWDRVKEKLDISHQEKLISFIYNTKTQKQHIAELATCVLELYGSDYEAGSIINSAIEGLCEMVTALSKRMQLEEFSLGLGGSLLLKSETYRKLFEEAIKEKLPKVNTHLPYKDAVYGALVLAWELGSERGREL